MMKSIFAVLLIAIAASASSAQDTPAEIQKYVDGRGGKKNYPTSVSKIVRGDLNGDGIEDVVVQYIVQEGSPGNYYASYIAVFLNRSGRLTYATEMPAGTKLSGNLVPDGVFNGYLTLDRFASNGSEKLGTVSYRLSGGKLVEVPTMKLDRMTNLEPHNDGAAQVVSDSGAVQNAKAAVPKMVKGGVLTGKALRLPRPEYPLAARAVRAGGIVAVRITFDENGDVISASAIRGNALLFRAAESAARKAKFAPVSLSGQPVKVTGVIEYNFVP